MPIERQCEQWPQRIASAPVMALDFAVDHPHHPSFVFANIDGKTVGVLHWWHPDRFSGDRGDNLPAPSPGAVPNTVLDIQVFPQYRRKGIATALFNWTKANVNPDLEHAAVGTEDYRQFARSMGSDPADFSYRRHRAQRIAGVGLHPDLAESHRAHGTVHTSGGRIIPGWKLAVADTATQQSRLADQAGWTHHVAVSPSLMAIQGARAYSSLRGFGDPHDTDYTHIMQDPQRVARVGQHYDSLPIYSPEAVPHYLAMQKEVNDQYDFLTKNMGIKVQPVDYDPYAHVGEMMADVNNNKTLKVLGSHITGGHPVFGNADNDKFRAVHDFFGHAATGRDFDRHGEHATYLAHSKMFSPQARPALTTETLGQNSSLILNGHFGPNKIGTIPRELTAHRTAGFGDDKDEEEFDGSYCQKCGEGDSDWCEACETCDYCDPEHTKHCPKCGPGDVDWCEDCEQCNDCDDHKDHCKSCGPNDSDWCEDCEKCTNCDWDHDAHCSYCGPNDSDWCQDCQQCKSCDGNCCDRDEPDSRPTSLKSPLFREHERPLTKEWNDSVGRMHLFLPHDINPASEAVSRPYIDFDREVDHYDTPALDLKLPPAKHTNYDRPLHEYHNGIDAIPVKSKGVELYRGLTVNLKHPELAPLRRAIYGDEKESYYSGTPNTHYYPKIRYHEPEPSYQPGMFPGIFSDKELAARPKHPDQLHDYLDLLLGHLSGNRNFKGLGVHWTTDLNQANSFANYGSPFNNENGHLPVRMKARWFGRGEDPYRRNTGEETAGDYEYEQELSMLPGAPLDLHDLEIYHPYTKQWHSLMDGDPRRVHAKKKKPKGPTMQNPGKWQSSSPYYKHWRGPHPMWFADKDGNFASIEDIIEKSHPRQLYQLLRTDNGFAQKYMEYQNGLARPNPEDFYYDDELPVHLRKPGDPGREFIGVLRTQFPDVMALLRNLKR